jgi:hypothetical protein
MRQAFTLVELIVVMGIIIVLSSLSIPAVHNYLLERQSATAIQTLGGTLLNAQALAQANFTTTAVRVERAFKTDDAGRMIKDASGNPIWLDHQRIRILGVGLRQAGRPIAGEERAFRQFADMRPSDLPPAAWLAPDDALSLLATGNTAWQPPTAGVAAIDMLDTFYIAFNRRGELVRLPAERLVYLDETQNNAFVGFPRPSRLGAIAYNHQRFEKSGGDAHWLQVGIPLYVDQRMGAIVKGEVGTNR